jgi:hypothetical protein
VLLRDHPVPGKYDPSIFIYMAAAVIALIRLKFFLFLRGSRMNTQFDVESARHLLESDPHSLDIFEAIELAERVEPQIKPYSGAASEWRFRPSVLQR